MKNNNKTGVSPSIPTNAKRVSLLSYKNKEGRLQRVPDTAVLMEFERLPKGLKGEYDPESDGYCYPKGTVTLVKFYVWTYTDKDGNKHEVRRRADTGSLFHHDWWVWDIMDADGKNVRTMYRPVN